MILLRIRSTSIRVGRDHTRGDVTRRNPLTWPKMICAVAYLPPFILGLLHTYAFQYCNIYLLPT